MSLAVPEQQPLGRRPRAILAGVACLGVVVGVWTLRPPTPTHAATSDSITDNDGKMSPVQSYASLAAVMRDGINEPFSEIAYLAFHADPEDGQATTAMHAAARRLVAPADELPLLAKRNFSRAERGHFDRQAAEFGRSVAGLLDAARSGDRKGAVRWADRMEATCRACHVELAPHLVHEGNPP